MRLFFFICFFTISSYAEDQCSQEKEASERADKSANEAYIMFRKDLITIDISIRKLRSALSSMEKPKERLKTRGKIYNGFILARDDSNWQGIDNTRFYFLETASLFEQSISTLDGAIEELNRRRASQRKSYEDFLDKKHESFKKQTKYNRCMNEQEQP